ncbi:MAG: aminotransferase class IV [Candidatus Levybacteria bacterium]|nr:aminotransferase class IV [Candidatus Levybacteria bacterium]
MSDFIHFLNGKFVKEDELSISPWDLGFVRGYAVADFLVTHQQIPFKLSEHVDRLFKSAEIIGLQVPWTKTQIVGWANETLDKNDNKIEKTLKIVLSGGKSHSMHQSPVPTLVMMVSQYEPPAPSYYENGVKAIAVNYKRQYPEAKHTHYVEAIRQLSKAQDKDIDEVIYYDESQVFEGAGCNLFAVIDNKLVTTKSNIVEGITRNVLLEILRLDIPTEVRDFTFDELQSATEVFLTGSSKKVRGVIEINGKTVGDGKVGEVTKEASKQFESYIEKVASSTA